MGAKAYGNINEKLTVGALGVLKETRDSYSVTEMNYKLPKGSFVNFAVTQADTTTLNHRGVDDVVYYKFGTWRLLSHNSWAAANGTKGFYSLTAFAYNAPNWWVDLHWHQVDPGYSPALGYVDYTDLHGPLISVSYDNTYRHGPPRYLMLNATAYRFLHGNGDVYQNNRNFTLVATTGSDYFASLTGVDSMFDGLLDRHKSLSITSNISNKYRQNWISTDWGTMADRAYGYINLGAKRRILGGVDISLSGSMVRYAGHNGQYILTPGRDFDAKRTLTMRMASQDGSVNAYLPLKTRAASVGTTFLSWAIQTQSVSQSASRSNGYGRCSGRRIFVSIRRVSPLYTQYTASLRTSGLPVDEVIRNRTVSTSVGSNS